MNRRGFTLAEVMIAMTMSTVTVILVSTSMINTQRAARQQFARIDVQEGVRAATTYINSVLREVDAYDGDVLAGSGTSMRFRSMRWTAVSCTAVSVVSGNPTVTVKNSLIYGWTTPSSTSDSLFLYTDGNTGTRNDDVWVMAGLTATAAQNCPDGSAGTRLTFTPVGVTSATIAAGFTNGSPIRGYAIEELSLYTDASNVRWLGRNRMARAGVWGGVEAVAGPLTSNGLAFTYFDSTGASTGTRTAIAYVGLTVRGQSTDKVRTTGRTVTNLRDSLVTRAGLRNNRRY
jgi:prepilin-type N-terminal cleavage/methylation domain-containing protein